MSDLLPSELKECGSLVFEYVNENTPNVVKDVLSCSLGTLVSGLETLDTEISYTGDSVRKILREEFGVNQCLAQDLGDVVKLGGGLAVSLLPGKLINSAVEGVKLMKLSAAGGPGSGFKFVLEDPKPKYRSLNLKDNGGISGSNGLGFKKTAQKTERIKTRVASTKIDLDRYVDGFLENKGALLNRGKTLDGHQYYEVMKKTEYMGQTFKKGDYISLDTLHYEVEWFSNPKTHKGAINVLTGEKYKDGIPGRVLKIK